MTSLKIGTIGWRNHADDVIQAYKRLTSDNPTCVYHPAYEPPIAAGSSNFNDLLKTDGIMVLSPNDTHMAYIEQLQAAGYSGYIFCEKPPVTNFEELYRLRKVDSTKIMYDFSLRYSDFAKRLSEMLPKVGEVISNNVWVTHGLAFKQSYPSSWRASVQRHKFGLLETVAIHWVDLALRFFGPSAAANHKSRNVAGTGTSTDTSVVSIRHAAGPYTTIVTSYAAPFMLRMLIIGTDGIIEYRDGLLMLSGPRETFDAAGRFESPPVVEKHLIVDPFVDGLDEALKAFTSIVSNKDTFPKQWFDDSLETMDVILECKGLLIQDKII